MARPSTTVTSRGKRRRFQTKDRWAAGPNQLLLSYRGAQLRVRCGACGSHLGEAWADDDPGMGALVHPLPTGHATLLHDSTSGSGDRRAVFHGAVAGRNLRTDGDQSGRITSTALPESWRWECTCGARPEWNFVSKVGPFVDALAAGKHSLTIT